MSMRYSALEKEKAHLCQFSENLAVKGGDNSLVTGRRRSKPMKVAFKTQDNK